MRKTLHQLSIHSKVRQAFPHEGLLICCLSNVVAETTDVVVAIRKLGFGLPC